MKKLQSLLFAVLSFVALTVFAPLADAQTLLTMTTLSTAASAGSGSVGYTQFVQVASATGIQAPSTGVGTAAFSSGTQTWLYVDAELMDVRGVSGTTIQVVRGSEGTAARAHSSGALVFVIPSGYIYGAAGVNVGSLSVPAGSCTRTSEPYLPRISFTQGIITDCLGGNWVSGGATLGPVIPTQFEIPAPNSGGTAYTSLDSSGTTLSATTQYCTEIDLPYNKLLTGLAVLNGTSADGTDKHLVALYDSGGNLLANSALAGAATSGTSTFQKFAFTSQYYAVGPAQYFGCMQTNGTTNTVRMIVTGTQDTYLTKGVTGQTFGTLSSFTAPTTFTSVVGPYFFVY